MGRPLSPPRPTGPRRALPSAQYLPRHTPDDGVAAILEARQRHPSWRAKQLVAILRTRHPRWPWPARSTVYNILKRHGVWSADFKGHFKTGDGRYDDPLPITDGDRRLLLRGQALPSTSVAEANPVFTRVFKEFGQAFGHHTNGGRHRNSQPADAWHPVHLLGVNSNAREFHCDRLREACPNRNFTRFDRQQRMIASQFSGRLPVYIGQRGEG